MHRMGNRSGPKTKPGCMEFFSIFRGSAIVIVMIKSNRVKGHGNKFEFDLIVAHPIGHPR